MYAQALITINEAAQIYGKSIQTIRRMIKKRKIEIKKQKTPQGFNYLVSKESLLEFIEQCKNPIIQDSDEGKSLERSHRSISQEPVSFFKGEVERFNSTIQKLIEQMERDKGNFFDLIKTFQDRNVALENRIKLLEAPRSSKWKFWK